MSILHQIRVARATLVAFAGMGVLWGGYMSLIPDIMAVLGASDVEFGSLILAAPVAAVSTMLIAPKVAPKIGHHVMPLSLMAFGLAFLLPGWMATPLMFALAMVGVGVTNAFLDVTMNARVSTLEVDRGMHLMNLNHAAYSFGYAGAAVLTGVARSAGWGPGPILTVLALGVVCMAFLTLEGGHGVNGFAREGGRRARMGRVPLWAGLIVMIAFMSENAVEAWSALHIERTLHAPHGAGSFGPAVLALTMGVGRTAGQIVVARLNEAMLMRWGTIIAAAGMAVVALAPTPMVAYAGLVVAGLGVSVIAPTAFAMVGRLSNPAIRAQAIARATALGYAGYFFGPPALGFLSEFLGLRVALLAMAGVILLTLALFPRLVAAGQRGEDFTSHEPVPDCA